MSLPGRPDVRRTLADRRPLAGHGHLGGCPDHCRRCPGDGPGHPRYEQCDRRTFEQPSHRDEHDGQHDSPSRLPTPRLLRPRLPAARPPPRPRALGPERVAPPSPPDGRLAPRRAHQRVPRPAPRPRTPARASPRPPPPPTRAPTASPAPTANPRTRVSPRATHPTEVRQGDDESGHEHRPGRGHRRPGLQQRSGRPVAPPLPRALARAASRDPWVAPASSGGRAVAGWPRPPHAPRARTPPR